LPRTVDLRQEFRDGTKDKVAVAIDDGTNGPEHLVSVCFKEFNEAAKRLLYEDEELFQQFSLCVKGNTQFYWDGVVAEIPQKERTTDRFYEAQKELLKAVVGPNQRDIIRAWVEFDLRNPRTLSPSSISPA